MQSDGTAFSSAEWKCSAPMMKFVVCVSLSCRQSSWNCLEKCVQSKIYSMRELCNNFSIFSHLIQFAFFIATVLLRLSLLFSIVQNTLILIHASHFSPSNFGVCARYALQCVLCLFFEAPEKRLHFNKIEWKDENRVSSLNSYRIRFNLVIPLLVCVRVRLATTIVEAIDWLFSHSFVCHAHSSFRCEIFPF